MSAIFPIGLQVEGRSVAVSGDNAEAAEKIERLLTAGAKVTLFAPAIAEPALAALASSGRIEWAKRWLDPGEVAGYFMVLSTRFDQPYSEAISSACRDARVLVSCFDKPALSDMSMPSALKRGTLQIAVFTGGASPVLARKIRQSLERIFDDRFVRFLDSLGALRERVKASEPDFERRREALHKAAEGFEIRGTIKYPDTDNPPE